MNVWLIADTHFGHKFMIEGGIRPDNYEKLLWDSMAEKVLDGDLLIHLGDLAFKPSTEVGQALKMIKGNKILVRGNHDGGFEKYFEMGFNAVVDEFHLNYHRHLHFTHEPKRQPFFGINIHGHLHGNEHRLQDDLAWYTEAKKVTGQYIDLAPEIWGYRVVSLNEVLKKFR